MYRLTDQFAMMCKLLWTYAVRTGNQGFYTRYVPVIIFTYVGVGYGSSP